MRTCFAILTCLIVLAACGGVDKEAIKSQIKDLEKKLRAANGEKAALIDKNTNIKTASFKATARYKSAKRKGDESAIAEAKANMEAAAQTAQAALDAEKALDDRIRDLKDKISALKKKIR
ncbi:MAG: hypothetical protein QNJ90_07365 [Planctomycetota bacterium]|nr:hypothetical protein [Planctomycetota bacterium]